VAVYIPKIIENLDDEQRTSLKNKLQKGTMVELKKGASAENLKENNNRLIKTIMGLDLLLDTSATYYTIFSDLDQVPTLVAKEKKSSKAKASSSLIKLSEYASTPPTTPQQPPP
jgi:hypothetical protein